MNYPSIEDYKYHTLWLEDEHGNEYPFVDGDYQRPEDVKIVTAHSCFALEVNESIYNADKYGQYGGKDLLFTGGQSYQESLALAMSRPSLKERFKSIIRSKKLLPLGDLKTAIRHACRCERCINSLAYAYGLDWGYSAFSDEWERCGTICDACKNVYSEKGLMHKALK